MQLRTILTTLRKQGFVMISQRGSHTKFRKKNGIKRTVIVKTTKKEVPYGTFRTIVLQSGLQESDFRRK